MTEQQFIEKNKPVWLELEGAIALLKRPIARRKVDVARFAEMYRLVSHNLAYANTHFAGSPTVAYLNGLITVAHNRFYVKQKAGLTPIIRYFTRTFPGLVRLYRFYIIAAMLMFLVAGVLTAGLSVANPSVIGYFFEDGQLDYSNLDPKSETGSAGLASYIMTNNIRVCLMNVAWGVTAGLGTIYVLIMNGGVLGALWAHFFMATGDFWLADFWALILPHGFIELAAIFISGGAGLLMGRGFLVPGELSRLSSFVKAAKTAAAMLPGIAVMLIVAGVIEGFFTPVSLAVWIKLAFSFITLLALVVYFIIYKPNADL